MKNCILVAAALALFINAGAQSTGSGITGEASMVSMYRNVEASHFSPISGQLENGNRTEAAVNSFDSYRMEHNKMVAVSKGSSTCMNQYTTLKNGSVVMPNGSVITSTGKVVHLKNGESVNAEGALTCSQKANDSKQETAAECDY